MGTRVPIFPGERGPGVPILPGRWGPHWENGDPQCGRPFSGDPIQLCSSNQQLDDKSWKHRSGFSTSTTAKAMTSAGDLRQLASH